LNSINKAKRHQGIARQITVAYKAVFDDRLDPVPLNYRETNSHQAGTAPAQPLTETEKGSVTMTTEFGADGATTLSRVDLSGYVRYVGHD